MSIASAVKARWDAGGFNANIAPIRLGRIKKPPQTPANQGVQGSSPEGTVLPRAEMSFSESDPVTDTSVNSLQEQFFFIDVWRKSSDVATLTSDMNLIRAHFNNSHASVSNPFDMGGLDSVQQVSFIGHRHEICDGDTVHSESCFVCRYCFANDVPS